MTQTSNCLRYYHHSRGEVLHWPFSSRLSKIMWQPQLWIGYVWISISVSLIFTAHPCHDLILALLYSPLSLLLQVFFPSVCECSCQPNVSHTLSLLPLRLWLSAHFYCPPPLSLSLWSVTSSSCDCSVCPLGIKQRLPLLQEGKLI